jgi:hypothetical protein
MASKKAKQQNQNKNTPHVSNANKPKPLTINYYSIVLAAVLLLILSIRYRLLGVPFERDEGEYAYMGNLILQGGVPYLDAYNMKLPGIFAMYSLFIAFFGNSPTGIHTGLMLMSIGTIILLYVSFKKLFNPMTALVSATVYGLLSISMPFFGFAAHATHFINVFAMLGLFFYTKYYETQKWKYAALVGLMFGLALLMKQQAAVLIVMAGLLIVTTELFSKPLNWKNLIKNSLIFSIAAVIPYLIVLVIMFYTGAFEKFWFWTVDYAKDYASLTLKWEDVKFYFHASFDKMFDEYPLIWLLALAGIVFVWLNKQSLFQKIISTTIVLFGFAAVCPGFYFREHYFILALPGLGLLVANSLEYIRLLISKSWDNSILKVLPIAAVLLIGLITIKKGKDYYFADDLELVNKRVYFFNPFVEAPEIAKYLNENTTKEDKIGILGSEPEIFVYANRKSASRYIYTYPLGEPHKYNLTMHKEMAKELETAKPKYMLYCNINTSWLTRTGTPSYIFDWANKYLAANYDLVGLVDIPTSSGRSQFYWGAEAGRKPQNTNYIFVFKKKGS